MFDVIIVGGGPAGLSAALVLGRCRRRVLVCDSGRPRNFAAMHVHGFLTRDGIEPAELQHLAREELMPYGVEWRSMEVVGGSCLRDGFEVELADGERVRSRKLLLATGVRDVLPEIPGFEELYGRGVHHCPYCDGWEHRDQRLAAYGKGRAAAGLALSLLTWSERVTACTDGEALSEEDAQRCREHGIEVRQERVKRLLSEAGALRAVELESGALLECDALFFNTGQVQRTDLAARLGCAMDGDAARTSSRQRTSIPGLFVAGDADREVQFVVVAAAEGATAAVAINHELQEGERRTRNDERGARNGEPRAENGERGTKT